MTGVHLPSDPAPPKRPVNVLADIARDCGKQHLGMLIDGYWMTRILECARHRVRLAVKLGDLPEGTAVTGCTIECGRLVLHCDIPTEPTP